MAAVDYFALCGLYTQSLLLEGEVAARLVEFFEHGAIAGRESVCPSATNKGPTAATPVVYRVSGKNEYPTKNLKSTSRLLVGCHTQASGYFWPGITTVLGFGRRPMTIEPMIP